MLTVPRLVGRMFPRDTRLREFVCICENYLSVFVLCDLFQFAHSQSIVAIYPFLIYRNCAGVLEIVVVYLLNLVTF